MGAQPRPMQTMLSNDWKNSWPSVKRGTKRMADLPCALFHPANTIEAIEPLGRPFLTRRMSQEARTAVSRSKRFATGVIEPIVNKKDVTARVR